MLQVSKESEAASALILQPISTGKIFFWLVFAYGRELQQELHPASDN